MKEWLISGNPKKYDVVGAFHKYKKIDWTQSANFSVGDIVYIYVSGDVKAIQFKCRVNKVDIEVPDIDDREFDMSGEFDGSAGRYMELEMIEEFSGEEYTREKLLEHGFKSPQGPMGLPDTMKTYLESLSSNAHTYGKFDSWTIVNEITAIKKCDKSFFEHRGSGIPAKIRWFFGIEDIENASKTEIELIYEGQVYSGRVEKEKLDLGRTRIFWSKELGDVFAVMRPKENDEFPELTFKKIEPNKYKVHFGKQDIFDMETNIDYIGVLNYLENNQEVPYSNPDAAGIDSTKKQELLDIKKKGQAAVAEMKKMAALCSEEYKLTKVLPGSWLDGSNTKTRKYLWTQMKYDEYKNSPVSISIFCEMGEGNKTLYRISVETKNDNSDKAMMEKFHSHLDLPLNQSAGLVYVAGSNEWGMPAILKDDQDIIKEKIESGDIKKVQICRYIYQTDTQTNNYFERELLKAVEALIPYYEHVIGMASSKDELKEDLEDMDLSDIKISTEKVSYQWDKNMILYGPPGTGKTYNTVIYAVAICCGRSFEEVASQPYTQTLETYKQLKKENRIAFTTFHQSYGYEEFIEGIKPVVNAEESELGYTIESGIFKSFCKNIRYTVPGQKTLRSFWEKFIDAAKDSMSLILNSNEHPESPFVVEISEDTEYRVACLISFDNKHIPVTYSEFKKFIYDGKTFYASIEESDFLKIDACNAIYNWMVKNLGLEQIEEEIDFSRRVFIIDEINRGNISKIFGELITLIEESKREGNEEAASAILPYSGEEFSVPQNVYILGTMNTADRSIALMDTALRRRFQFIEMMPSSKVLRDIHADKVEDLDVAEMLDVINERITFLYDREHTIGHAFFTKLANTPTIECLKSIFEKSVIPLLQEYFYEDYQKIQLVLGDNGKTDDSHKFILDEEVKVKSIFKGNAEDIVDLPEKKYTINADAFEKIESYKEIM